MVMLLLRLATMMTLSNYTWLMSLLVMHSVVCWEMTLLHVNDIHVRMEETNVLSSNCKPAKKAAGECFGGLARLHAAVKDINNTENNVLWLNAGDFYQGTVWYTHFKWRVVSHFNNLLNFDAITLGNHEFDDAVSGVVPFLKNQTCPVVVANMDVRKVPELRGLYQPSVVLTVGGRKVGVVGYITPETMEVSNPGNDLIITDEVEAVRKEVDKLHAQGVDIIVCLGHSGYEKDMEIAEKVPHVDLVVGGHTHSFLFSETKEKKNPSMNTIRGPYPTIVNNVGGSKALVVQAYAYTKYLGHAKLNFSQGGKLLDWSGEPILLDSRYKQDPAILEELRPWKEKIDIFGRDVLGSTAVVLAKSRQAESNVGNFITDSMVWHYRDRKGMSGEKISLSLINSGSVRASFEIGNITMVDLLTTMPFSNTFDLVTLSGKNLRQVLEHSVSKMESDGSNDDGGFLQVAGFRLKYDLSKDIGQRLVEALVLEGGHYKKGGLVPEGGQYKPLNDKSNYDVVITDYLLGGGNGYKLQPIRKLQGPLDVDVLKQYLHSASPIHAGLEGRLTLVTRGFRQNETRERSLSTVKILDQTVSNISVQDQLIGGKSKQDPASKASIITSKSLQLFVILNILKYIYVL